LVISSQASTDLAPMSQLVDYGLRIRRGEIKDPNFHLTLYSAPAGGRPVVNQDLAPLEDVRRLAKQTQRMPGQENTFSNLVLGITAE
jgi:hypothetical protein